MDVIQYIYHAINSPEYNFIGCTYQLLLSLLLGSIVGFERRRRGQSAGVRTFSLISLGSTLAMILSVYAAQAFGGDSTRIAAQVISGIGFLGAGAIIQMKGSVRGLTTAAGIWMVSAIGMTVGCGLYLVAAVATGIVMFVLVLLERIEHSLRGRTSSRIIRIRTAVILKDISTYKEVMERNRVEFKSFYVEYDFDAQETRLNLVVLVHEDVDYISLFGQFEGLYPTKSITLANQINI